MSHKNKVSLVRQVQETLENKLAIGVSKHDDKAQYLRDDFGQLVRDEYGKAIVVKPPETSEKIYSYGTFRVYMRHCNYFTKWCGQVYHCKTLEECRTHVDEWLLLQQKKGYSAYTIKLQASALAKLYGCSTEDFVKTQPRHRADITRSRGNAVRDAHFSETNHADLILFCKATGLRRRELSLLTGDKLVIDRKNRYILIDKGGKGGRKRYAPIIGTPEEVKRVVEIMQNSHFRKVFPKVPNGADIHGYRADYAVRLYKLVAREIETIPFDQVNRRTGVRYQSDVYVCKKDRRGVKLDKYALKVVSKALGHNRISVVAEHYLDEYAREIMDRINRQEEATF